MPSAAALIDVPSCSRLSPINSPGWGGLFIAMVFASFNGLGLLLSAFL